MEPQAHWERLGHRLARMGLPQVPGQRLADHAAALLGGCEGLTVLLGLTPAFADLGARVEAFDATPGMIAAVWPGDTALRRARVADWRALPVQSGTARQVIGDGALNSVPDRAAVRAVLAEVRRVLAPGGRAAIRVFTRPDPAETAAEVLAAAEAGRIASLNALRWRIAAALALGPAHEVAVADIVSVVAPLGDLADFARARGMQPDEAEHFLAYRGSPARYVFPDRAVLEADAEAVGLGCAWVPTEGYPGADLCPFAVLGVI
ncbi:MAG: hypothetical protein B7Z10_05965 [Rhodobacterales bacterium 32-66-7]|nr:MAG: hypothetical protein B7Z31_07805 [Rhodobacterales bacterium 12-65-15]OYX25569.1 MAG: hypothetical protein B7Z10_05965 [Rhodobacterales bacterium 32-66-7]